MVEFETTDPALRGEMTVTITLTDADGGTICSPSTMACRLACRPPTTRRGWRMALAKLAALVEEGSRTDLAGPG